MKRKNDFAAKLLAVCLALVLAAGMLAVPAMATGAATPSPANSTVPGDDGGDDTGNGGNAGIASGTPYVTGSWALRASCSASSPGRSAASS